MNVPNQLTVARMVLTVLFVVSLSIDWAFACTTALALFIVASITDYVDGELARRWNMETNFGRLMDPLADKVMMAAALICLSGRRVFPPWVAVIIIGREFLITGLRMLAASRGKVLPAEKLGKHKMVWQIVAVIFFLLVMSVQEIVSTGALKAPGASVAWLRMDWHPLGLVLLTIAVGLTIYSGVGYVWKHRSYIAEM
ncbi:MAG TPA: CDP-diacylglycerol--glycerol-3-phosphate 3-phosphatidyltransferase [Chthoniobacteraceae bacterium]|jgi:CDP-diacylglycerol--glycerol-3-phosphate 3-phosphatidyltransferase|nr:CDP-diacylglycerol--glycerol-3-phosphate 3-phosphatidyltransferase [Chthoniobacteraceae bacterium]